jgi:1L-myo-inositol 1-phosphate cytidylyltransferase
MDDATKVACRGGYITRIGKDLTRYDAVDTGMFLCSLAVFDALDAVVKDGNCSLSDGMQFLASHRRMRSFDIGDAVWQDIDTPEMLDFAEMQISQRPTLVQSQEVAHV